MIMIRNGLFRSLPYRKFDREKGGRLSRQRSYKLRAVGMQYISLPVIGVTPNRPKRPMQYPTIRFLQCKMPLCRVLII